MTIILSESDFTFLSWKQSSVKSADKDLNIAVSTKASADEIQKQILANQDLRKDLRKFRESLDDIEDHDEVDLKGDLDEILEGKYIA